MSRFLRSAVDSRLVYLLEQAERFETFHAANARLALNDFLAIFTQDDVLTRIWAALRAHLDLAPQDWHAEVKATGALPSLPAAQAGAMAFRLATLRYVQREKVDLRHFVSNYFPGAHLNERLMGWKRLFVHPFAADLRLLGERLGSYLDAVEVEGWVDLDGALAACLAEELPRAGFGPRAWTDADDEAFEAAQAAGPARHAPPPAAGADPSAALAALRARLADASLADDLAHDLTLDLDALALELERPSLARGRFLARLESVAAHAPLAGAAAELRAALG